MLISSRQFSDLVGISHDRLEQRRLRERAAADVVDTMGEDELVAMPIAPHERGQPGLYDALDATRLRCVIILENAGVQFSAACRLLRAVGPEVMFPDGNDVFATAWQEPSGLVRRIVGTTRDVARALPEKPPASFSINVTSTRDDVAGRAAALLGLRLVGTNFEKDALP